MRTKILWLWLLVVCSFSSLVGAQAEGTIYRVEAAHGLTAPAARLISRALTEATAADAQALLIEISDGGAVMDVARPLAREAAAAHIPVVVWIGPRGTKGGAGGALLLTAAHIAAMAPGTSAGVAQPLVDVSSSFSATTQQQVVDDFATTLRGWQLEHGRNADWADRAARAGAIISSEEAQAATPPVIDVVAADETELLQTLEGRIVKLGDGTSRQVRTLGARVVTVDATAWEMVSQLLALPTVAFLCLVLAALALGLELSAPGVTVPGVGGVVLLIAALYGLWEAQVRPLAIIALLGGLVLLCAEPLVLAHGGLAAGGLVLLVVGALWLNDPSRNPGLAVAPLALVGTVVVVGA
ncbi:MAG: nodulation protein NfeD, partial [Herpetosiphonaceae bacterium]|nr:nodulation protein NfeD [Herpetosiphonaceae bacterium]